MTERAYLDNAATTPMLASARERWLEVSASAGNPSSLHASGRAARQIVEEARESIAADLGGRPSSILFTSGGTEADNLAVKGMFWQREVTLRSGATVLCSAIEHHAILDPVHWLGAHEGAMVQLLRVDPYARVDLDQLQELLDLGNVALCTVMWANNEVGTVQPIQRIAQMCRAAGVLFHTDAVQALGQIRVDVAEVGAHAVTISSHKVGGPFGVGALVLDPSITLTPVMHGGGQERDIRSGTLDAPAIAAFAVAVSDAVSGLASRAAHVRALRNDLVTRVLATVPSAVLNGDPDLEGGGRLPGNAHFSFPGCEGDALLMLLDAAGVDCSTGSACTAGIPEPSHVLLAMGVNEDSARATLRFSFGRESTSRDVDVVVAALPAAVERAARAGSLSGRPRT